MSQFLRQSTVATLKPGPLLSPSDGLTPYTAPSFTVKVGANGASLVARHDSTSVSYDADGYFIVELDATDTATLGRLIVSVAGLAENYLPIWHEYTVLSQPVYDSLFGTVSLAADPWAVPLPGSYSAGSAGKLLGAALTTFQAQSGTTSSFVMVAGDPLFAQNNVGMQVLFPQRTGSNQAGSGFTAMITGSNTSTGSQTFSPSCPTAVDSTFFYVTSVPLLNAKLTPDGLDAVSTTPASNGVTPNFRQMVVANWRRFFRKFVATTGGTLTGYADDGTTVLTTQTVPAPTATQTQGPSA